jgi:aflatoxin B1 aldehyde reductase
MVSRMRPGTALGTMEFGRGPCVGSVPEEMTSAFLSFSNNFQHIDTAFMYNGGKTDTILGEMECWKGKGLMDDKINPWDKKNFGEESIRKQVDTCLARLKVPSVEIMYLHAPDHNTPLEVTMEVMDKLHKEGKFNQLGLSNYSSWLVAEVVNVCKANNWIKPTVYQGMYSTITRQVEEELIPCLRFHGLAFYAYSPLGGGILSGKYKFDQEEDKSISKGRFNGVGWDKVYRQRYWKQEHFQAMESLKELLVVHHPEENISLPEAAFRWIYNHSLLDGAKGDCVVLGASRMEQLQMNMEMSQAGPMKDEVVTFMDQWWKSTKHLCPNYFR